MKLTSRYSISAISSFQQGQVLVHNLAKSPVGAGWGIAGLERLHPQPDGSMVLTDGNGAILRFQAAPILENGLEARMFNTNDPVGAVGSGFAGLTSRSFQVTTASGTRFTDRFNFPVINFPDGDFDTSAFYNVGPNGFVDAGSGETSPQGDDISIQPPGGNETFGVQFSGFLFLPDGGDVVFTVGVDDTFDLIVNGESVVQFLGGTDFQNFSGTARNLPSGFVPILLNYGDIAFEANLVLQASGGGLPGGVVPSSFLFASPEGGGPPDEFLAPAGDFSTLQSNQDGTFTRIFKDGTAHHFDASGLQTAMVDAADNATNYSYDSAGRLTTLTDPMGLVTSLSYGAEHLATVTDFAGRVTELEHDAEGNLTRITDADGSIREFEFDACHRLVLQRSKRGFETLYEYNFAGQNVRAVRPDGSLRDIFPQNAVGLFDPASGVGQNAASPAPVLRPEEATALFVDGNGNGTTFNIGRFGSLKSRVDPLGRLTTIERDADGLPVRNVEANGTVTERVYDDRGNLLTRRRTTATALELRYEPRFNQITQITDEAGHQTFFEYDDQGNRTRTTDSLGHVATATFDSQGLVQTRTDENGNLTTFTYDAIGNLETLTDPLGIVTRFTRDVVGNVTAITEGLGTPEERTSTLTYDVLDRVRSETDPTGGLLRGVYDPAGNLVEAIGPGGELTRLSYDASDRLVGLDDPLSGSTSLMRDDNGNLVELIDSLGRTTVLAYDATDQLIAMTDALGNSQEKTYDALGNVLTLEDARGGVTRFTYDFLGRLIQQVSPLGRTTLFAYDVRDNLVEVTDPSGQAIQLSFDALSRPVRVITPDNLIEATYDAVGNLLTITDDDSALEFVYDANNRAVSEATYDVGVQPAVTLTSGFNAVENRVTLSDSLGGTARYTFDSSDRLTELITAAGDFLRLSSDASGRETGIVFPNGVTTHRAYDPRGRLTNLAHTLTGADLARFSYGHDALSNIVSIDEIGRTLAFTYDGLGRLTAAGSPLAPENYSYDPEGNRDASHLSALHIHDVDNQLLEDAAFTYAYHPSGNLASKTEKASGGVTTYAYDALHQLVRVDRPDGVVARYRYDALGRRSEKSVDGVITRYVYNREDIVLEFDGSNTLTARYSHGGDIDQPLSQQRDGQSYFYHADHQGSIRQITDSSGQVVNAYEYDAYGQITSSVEGIVNPYTYTGREQDAESGLLFYRLRTYDPHTGRFLQRDPIGFEAGDTNLYRYVFSDPVNLVDPSGLGALGAAIGGTAGAIIGGVIGGTAGGTGGGLVGAFAGPPGAAGGVVLGGSEGAALGAAAGLTVGALLGSIIEDALDNVVFSKGGKSRPGDELRPRSNEEIHKGARAKARTKAEKAEKKKFVAEAKFRELKNKQKRANNKRNSGKKKKKNNENNCN
jgi:RHS repeat-associated protein